MSHPAYPSNSQLRAERIADLLLAEQDDAATRFRAALDTFAAAFDALDFPLGCPVRGYELADVHGIIADLGALKYVEDYEDAAADAAQVA